MTIDEAIQILSTRDWSGMLCGYIGGYTEALEMAIKSLETQKGISVSEKSCNTCGQKCAIKYHGCSNWIPNNSEEVNADESNL